MMVASIYDEYPLHTLIHFKSLMVAVLGALATPPVAWIVLLFQYVPIVEK